MKVGVLALQGDFEAHAGLLRAAGATALEVRTADELAMIDALVIPGGESTSFRIIARAADMLGPLRERVAAGLPVLGTCAGLIACADRLADEEPLIGGVDITVRRNAYGRQVDSFEADVEVVGVGLMRAVFIRAPRVEQVGSAVEILATYGDAPVVVRQGPRLLAAFHPELTGDDRLHRAFLDGL